MVFRVIVRSRRDKRAVEAAISRFMDGWMVSVETLGGARGDKLVDAILDSIEPFTIILLGKEDSWVAGEVDPQLPPFTEVLVTRASKVRNNTIEYIYSILNRGRASIRLYTVWGGDSFVFSRLPGKPVLNKLEIQPQGDSFYVYGAGAKTLSLFLLKRIGGLALLFKGRKGRHLVYSGPEPIGELYIDDKGMIPKGEAYRGSSRHYISLERLLESNKDVIQILEKWSVESLRKTAGDPDTVVVPWSGGKDSTAALLIAVETFGRDRVKAVYVDTGIDFLENLEYVEKTASLIGVDLFYKKADVDYDLLNDLMPMPDPSYRWCTGKKLDALREGIKEASSGKTVIITGDRDGESEKRGRRPVIRKDQKLGLDTIAPIKLWSGSHVLTYLHLKGVGVNPLYEAGFYRIGCYVCFALRSWEIDIMKRSGIIKKILEERPSHKVLFDRFLEMKKRGHGGEFGDCLCGV